MGFDGIALILRGAARCVSILFATAICMQKKCYERLTNNIKSGYKKKKNTAQRRGQSKKQNVKNMINTSSDLPRRGRDEPEQEVPLSHPEVLLSDPNNSNNNKNSSENPVAQAFIAAASAVRPRGGVGSQGTDVSWAGRNRGLDRRLGLAAHSRQPR